MYSNNEDEMTNLGVAKVAKKEEGYTLVEVLVTMVIIGSILLVINMVLISMIRVAYNTDVRIKMRQGVEFAFEVMRRNAKSTDPGTLEKVTGPDGGDALHFFIPGDESEEVLFYRTTDSNGNGVIKATWQGSLSKGIREVDLTSPYEVDVKDFTVAVSNSARGGSTEVVLTITADSMHKRNANEPLIQNLVYQTNIIARYREL